MKKWSKPKRETITSNPFKLWKWVDTHQQVGFMVKGQRN